MDQQELERVVGGLGRRAAERLDVDVVARAVIERLRSAERADRVLVTQPRPLLRWLASAAAVALLVAGSVVTFRAGPPPVAASAGRVASLYDLSSDELSQVLDSLSSGAPASAGLAAGLEDLDAEQLRELLALMEG